MGQKRGFKNLKLGKNVHRQMKRRGKPENLPSRQQRVERRGTTGP